MFPYIKNLCVILTGLLFIAQLGYSQKDKPFNFNYPLPTPLQLSGNFGELRSNHFHSGLDIKTNGQQGAEVKAIEKGYISRIKISHGGFGKAIYINHPNGLTSVYAHLKNFNNNIESYVKTRQYEKQSYEIELFPAENELITPKGETIAFSGNSGGSYGPHLHFEIRNTSSQHPLNPHAYGINVNDNQIPSVDKIRIVAFDELNKVYLNENTIELAIDINKHEVRISDTLIVPYAFSIQFYGYDKASTSSNRLGIYDINLWLDNIKKFKAKFDEFSFSESRYINACIDYPTKKLRKQTWTRCYLLPHNKFSIYNKSKVNGLIQLEDNNVHIIKLKVGDYYGNTKSILIPVIKSSDLRTNLSKDNNYTKLFYWQQENRFMCEGLELNFKENTFYNNVKFNFKEFNKSKLTYTPIYSLHKDSEPVHKYFTIRINIDENISDKSKLCIASLNESNFSYEGGDIENGVIKTRIRSFGKYTVIADTIAPVLEIIKTPLKGKSSKLTVKLKDDLSGIDSYKVLVNKKWLLMEFDPKSNKMTGDLDDLKLKGTLNIECFAMDEKENKNYLSKTIEW